jgi:flagellar FliL protein
VTVEAMSRDAAVIESIRNNEPAIRNDLVLLYSAQQYDALASPAGKEQLRAETLAAIRKVVSAEGARAEAVEGVYFTSFVIQ